MQERKIKNWKKRIRISNHAIIDEDDLWLVSNYINALLNYDINKGNLKKIYLFPEKFINTYLTVSYVKVGNKLFFAPYNSQNLWCFHIETENFEKIDLKLRNDEKDIQQKFRTIFYYKGELILIGFKIPCILRIDIKTNRVQRHDEYLIGLKKRGIEKEEAILGYHYQRIKDSLYLPMLNQNIIVMFHLTDNRFELFNIENLTSKGFDAIDYCNKKFRLISSDGKEVIWKPKDNQKAESKLNLPENDSRNYWTTMHYKAITVYFPLFDTKIWIKNNEEKVKSLSFLYPKPEVIPNGSRYEFIKQNKERIYFQVRTTGDGYYVDLKNMEIHSLNLAIPDDDMCNQILKEIIDSIDEEKISETEVMNIENYISLFNLNRSQETRRNEKKGKLIYTSLR